MDDYARKRHYREQKRLREAFDRQLRQRLQKTEAAEHLALAAVPTLHKIVDAEDLIKVFYTLKREKGPAPGPDRITYKDLAHREICSIARALATEIQKGRYMPSEARHVEIPKKSGGTRTLSLRSIVNRVVDRALTDALTPYFEQIFLPCSHGFRPGFRRGVASMLVALEKSILERQHFVVAQDDVYHAFDSVPIRQTVELFSRYIQDFKLLNLIEKVLSGNPRRTRGIDQGSALSPLALNVLLHHTMDVPFTAGAAIPIWLRYADNLAWIAKTEAEAQTALQEAETRLNAVGMRLKGKDGPPVDLRQKDANVRILGFILSWDGNRIQYEPKAETWEELKEVLEKAQTTPNPPWMLWQVIQGWIEGNGPGFEDRQEKLIVQRILQIAAEAGFREISPGTIRRKLQLARDQWRAYRRKELGMVPREDEEATAPLVADAIGQLDLPDAGAAGCVPAVPAPF